MRQRFVRRRTLSLSDLFRRAVGYVVRILCGENPGDLPVRLPTCAPPDALVWTCRVRSWRGPRM